MGGSGWTLRTMGWEWVILRRGGFVDAMFVDWIRFFVDIILGSEMLDPALLVPCSVEKLALRYPVLHVV